MPEPGGPQDGRPAHAGTAGPLLRAIYGRPRNAVDRSTRRPTRGCHGGGWARRQSCCWLASPAERGEGERRVQRPRGRGRSAVGDPGRHGPTLRGKPVFGALSVEQLVDGMTLIPPTSSAFASPVPPGEGLGVPSGPIEHGRRPLRSPSRVPSIRPYSRGRLSPRPHAIGGLRGGPTPG